MSKSLEDQVSKLRQMIDGYNSKISARERQAIELAVRVLSVIEHCDKNELWVESYVMQDGRSCLRLDAESKLGVTLLECFSEAGRAL